MTKATTIFIATMLAAVALPGVAFAQASAFGSLSLGYVSTGRPDSDERETGPNVIGAASVAYSFTPELGVQGDVLLSYEPLEFNTSDATLTATAADLALHGFYRTDNFLVGGIVQLGRTSTQFNDNDPNIEDRRYAGVEGQLYLDNFTLYGQAGIKDLKAEYQDFSGYFGKLEGRYFLTPDFRIEAHLGIGTLDVPELDEWVTTTLNVGLGAEYKIADMPFSIFAEYDYYRGDFERDDDPIGERHRAVIGIRFQIEDETLLDRDRKGPSLEPIEPGGYFITPF